MSESQSPLKKTDGQSAPPPVDCAKVLELVPAYAIGAADADEIALVEAALPVCPQVAQSLLEYRRLARALLWAPPSLVPPASLRERVLRTAAADTSAQRRDWLRIDRSWLVAAAAVVALIFSNLIWFARVAELQQRTDLLSNWSVQKDALLLALSSGTSQRIDLIATDDSRTPSASVLYSPAASYAVLVTDRLPALPPERTYQLWLQRGDERLSAGVFTIDPDGRGALVFRTREPLTEYTGLGISVEPAGGSPAPTTSAIASVRF